MRYTTAGESHGPEEIAVIEGIPAGLHITQADIDEQLARANRDMVVVNDKKLKQTPLLFSPVFAIN